MFLQPMLLGSADYPFDHPSYIHEPKIDGHRLILSFINGKVRLYTRHQTDCTRQYPELHNVPVDDDVILDGEVAVFDDVGNVDFDLVMDRFRTTKSVSIQAAARSNSVNFVVFDILHYKGRDLRGLPLLERKRILDEVLEENSYFTKIKYIEEYGKSFFNILRDRSLEGMVSKRKDSLYVGRRSSDWLKIINYFYYDLFIAGYRKDQFGLLANIQDETGRFKPAGIIELGMPPTHRKVFYSVARSIVTGEDRNFVYLEPRILIKAKTRGWTKNGYLRTPAFVDFII